MQTESSALMGARAGAGPFPWHVALLACAVSLLGVAFGYDIGIISSTLSDMSRSVHLSTFDQEMVTSGLNYVSAFGAVLVAGNLGDRLGRRTVLLVAATLLAVGALIVSLGESLGALLLGRALQGVASGCAWCSCSVYIAEIAPAAWRGALVSISDIAINLGILLGFIVGRLVSLAVADRDARWRVSIAVAAVLPLLYLAAHPFLPETPRWLAMAGRDVEAVEVLRRLDPSLSEKAAAEAMRAIAATLPPDSAPGAGAALPTAGVPAGSARAGAGCAVHGSPWGASLGLWGTGASPAARRRACIAVVLGACQQLSGTEAILYYTPRILNQCVDASGRGGLSALGALSLASAAPCLDDGSVFLVTLAVGVVKFIGEVAIACAVDRVGRRGAMTWAALAIALCQLAIALRFAFDWPVAFGATALALTMLCFSLGPGPLTVVVLNEMLPLQQRAKVMSIAVFANRAVSGTVALTFLTLSRAIGEAGIFSLYAALGLAVAAFYRAYLPDMTGRSLEASAELF